MSGWNPFENSSKFREDASGFHFLGSLTLIVRKACVGRDNGLGSRLCKCRLSKKTSINRDDDLG